MIPSVGPEADRELSEGAIYYAREANAEVGHMKQRRHNSRWRGVSRERIVIPVTPGQKRALVRRAKALDLSVAEYVCRFAEGFRPDADNKMLAALASELKRSAKDSRAALGSALAGVKATLAQMQTRKASRRGERHREDLTTSRLNEIYGRSGEESSLDREVALLQSRSLPRDR